MTRQTSDPFAQARDFFLDSIFPWRSRIPVARPTPKRESDRAPILTKSFIFTFLCATVWFLAALCGLWQWGTQTPWSGLDVYSIGLLALVLVWCSATAHFHRDMFASREVMLEASGMTFDRLMFFWIDLFAAAEILVFFDYGRWHLVPALRQPALQILGLTVCALGASWLIWTDAYLSRQFHDLDSRKMMCRGPYRFVRHPRYAALILCSAGIALTMASAIAWVLAVGWFCVNVQRVNLEDAHLRELFGAEYDAYAARTARFFPGIY